MTLICPAQVDLELGKVAREDEFRRVWLKTPAHCYAAPGIVLKYFPASGGILVKLSIPRLRETGATDVNFPLNQHGSVEDIPLQFVEAQLNSFLGEAAKDLPPISQWPVCSATYSIDIRVERIDQTLDAVIGRIGGRARIFADGGSRTGISCGGSTRRQTIYNKQKQITDKLHRRHTKRDDAASEVIAAAADILRLEERVHGRRLREEWGLAAYERPTLQLLARRDVARFFVLSSMRRLGIDRWQRADAMEKSSMGDFMRACSAADEKGFSLGTYLFYAHLRDHNVPSQDAAKVLRLVGKTATNYERKYRRTGGVHLPEDSNIHQHATQDFLAALDRICPQTSSEVRLPRHADPGEVWSAKLSQAHIDACEQRVEEDNLREDRLRDDPSSADDGAGTEMVSEPESITDSAQHRAVLALEPPPGPRCLDDEREPPQPPKETHDEGDRPGDIHPTGHDPGMTPGRSRREEQSQGGIDDAPSTEPEQVHLQPRASQDGPAPFDGWVAVRPGAGARYEFDVQGAMDRCSAYPQSEGNSRAKPSIS